MSQTGSSGMELPKPEGRDGAYTPEQIDQMQKTWRPRHNIWMIAIAVTAAAFMEVLDTTIVNVSLPHIAGTLGSSYDDATWALTSYLVANGIVLILSSWLSKYFGEKRYFLLCIGMFTLLSFLCGLATSLPELVVFRALQGIFGGGLQPCSQSIILDIFPPDRRAAVFGLQAMAMIVGPVMGPVLGGWLTDDYSWRYVFWVNVPIGALTFMAVSYLVETPPWARTIKEHLDVIGTGLIALGLGCLEVMSDRGQDDDWFGSPFIVWMGIIGAGGTIAAILWLLRSKNPIIDLRVFKDRNFAVGWALMAVMGAILYSSGTLIPKLAQEVLGYTAEDAGLIMAPGGVAIILGIPIVGRLMPYIQSRYLIMAGFALWGYGLFYTGHLAPNISFHNLVIYRIWQAAPLALLFTPISTISFSTVNPTLNGDASALFAMARCYLGSQAISISQAAQTQMAQIHQTSVVARMIPSKHSVMNYILGLRHTAMLHGMDAIRAGQWSLTHTYEEILSQSQFLGCNEIFMWEAMLSVFVIPLCFLFSPSRGGPKPGQGH